jgi:2Fe-2S iron-sulfur cluster binding domain
MIKLNVNGRPATVNADPDTPLLWVLREQLGLTGTKYGCGIAACGACTVHVDGSAVRSCSFPLSEAKDRNVTTIEGLSRDRSHPGAEGLDRRTGPAMRLLPERHDHGRCGAARREAPPDRCRHRCRDYQHLPLRDLLAYPQGHSCRGQRHLTQAPPTSRYARSVVTSLVAATAIARALERNCRRGRDKRGHDRSEG